MKLYVFQNYIVNRTMEVDRLGYMYTSVLDFACTQ